MSVDVPFGRQAVCEKLGGRLDALMQGYRQNLAILGRDGVGKAPVLDWLIEAAHGRALPVLTIQVPVADWTGEFTRSWVLSLLAAAVSFHRHRAGADVSSRGTEDQPLAEPATLWQEAQRVIPAFCESVRDTVWATGRRAEPFSGCLEATARWQEAIHDHAVVVLKDFDRLESLYGPGIFKDLSRSVMIQKDTLYVVTSSRPYASRDILQNRMSMLFGHFERIDLAPFDDRAVHAFWPHRIGRALDPAQSHFIWILTHGMPSHLERLAVPLKRGEDLISAFDELFFSPMACLDHHFETRMESMLRAGGGAVPQQILLGLAQHPAKSGALAVQLRRHPSEIQKWLTALESQDLVGHHGAFYRLTDPLFGFWLLEVYRVKMECGWANESARRAHFRHGLRTRLASFEDAMKMPVPERLVRLFHRFGNELVEDEKRRFRLPRFTDVTYRPSTNGHLSMVAQQNGREGVWALEFCSGPMAEPVVEHFLEKCRKSGKTIQRKILVALGSMEPNAVLLAQENSVWVWRSENINRLMELYGEPPVAIYEDWCPTRAGA